MPTIGWAMIALVVFWLVWSQHKEKNSCYYCGTYKGHDDHCPYAALYDDD